MGRDMMVWMLLGCAGLVQARAQTPRPKFEAFDAATIKPSDEREKGRYITMEGTSRFLEKDYTLKLLIAAAYDLNPKTIVGGPSWMESEHVDIVARTPGEVRPTHDEQMAMLRTLLSERFRLKFHREQKEYSIFALTLVKPGAGLKASPADSAVPPTVGPGMVNANGIVLPGRNATVGELASLLQRAILDRPVVDRTGLAGRFDFDLAWAPDGSEFGGDGPKVAEDGPVLPLFAAIQKQLGLKLEATRGMVSALVVDSADRVSEN